MKPNDMRSMTREELQSKLESWRDELFRARCNLAIGQLKDTSSVVKLRRDIARAMTVIYEPRQDGAAR